MDRGWILVNFMVLGPLLGHVSAAVREFERLRVSQWSSRHAQSILREILHRTMSANKFVSDVFPPRYVESKAACPESLF